MLARYFDIMTDSELAKEFYELYLRLSPFKVEFRPDEVLQTQSTIPDLKSNFSEHGIALFTESYTKVIDGEYTMDLDFVTHFFKDGNTANPLMSIEPELKNRV